MKYLPALSALLFPTPYWRAVRVGTITGVGDWYCQHGTLLWRHYDALIRCENCTLAYMAHTDDGKCLYDATYYKRHHLATHEPKAYDIVTNQWVRVLEDR